VKVRHPPKHHVKGCETSNLDKWPSGRVFMALLFYLECPYLVVAAFGLRLSTTASMWVPSVNHLLHGLPPIIPIKAKRFCKFDLFWLVGSLFFGW
jgi:hypothetical protein